MMPSQSSSSPLHTSVPPPVPPTHCMVPAMHLVTPPLQWPLPAAPHGSPSPATLSSTTPSQSPSMPLQASAPPRLPPWHPRPPPKQCSTPGVHTPIELPQLPPPSGSPSSIRPSQLSSMPLQRSTLLPVLSLHTSAPAWHTMTPSRQASASGPSQLWPTVGSCTASSTTPLQLLSMPSHISRLGAPAWQTRPPALHAVTPFRHCPTCGPASHGIDMSSHWQLAPTPVRSGSASSILPSQSLSMPSQISADGTHGGVNPSIRIAMSSKSLSPPRNRSSKPNRNRSGVFER